LAGAATVAPFVATAAAVADAAPEIVVVVGAEIDDEGEGSGGGGDGNGGGGGGGECRAGFAALSAISGFYPRTMMWGGMEGRWVVCMLYIVGTRTIPLFRVWYYLFYHTLEDRRFTFRRLPCGEGQTRGAPSLRDSVSLASEAAQMRSWLWQR
jgi:hypothetical protein